MAKNNELNFNLPSVDDLFEPAQGKDIMDIKKIIPISIKEISDFPEHPFRVVDDEKMQDMVKSIKERGVMLPAIVRPKKDGGYEMISGHRRKRACELAKISEIPCIIKDLTDEEATVLMVDTNIQQREEILPSEKAFAYKMKLEALNHQGKRTDLTSGQSEQKLENKNSRDKLAEDTNESGATIRRYVRLTELIPELLELVDNQFLNKKEKQKMAFLPAVELSYLSEEEQYVVLDCIEYNEITPSHAQAIHLKKLSQEGNLTAKNIEEILEEKKPNQKEQVKFNYDRVKDYFPKGYTVQQMQDVIENLLQKYKLQWKNKQYDR